jgi:uncharacterized Zn-binding protein involved in type VI secretion
MGNGIARENDKVTSAAGPGRIVLPTGPRTVKVNGRSISCVPDFAPCPNGPAVPVSLRKLRVGGMPVLAEGDLTLPPGKITSGSDDVEVE